MTAYAAACSCGWQIGPLGDPRKGHGRFAGWYVHARDWLHHRRCRQAGL